MKRNFDIWLVNFDKQNFMMGTHRAVVINHPTNYKICYIVPLTTKQSNFNQQNPYFLELENNRYANISLSEIISMNDTRFIKPLNDQLSQKEQKDLSQLFGNMMRHCVENLNSNIFKEYPDDFIVHRLNENIYKQSEVVGQRTIDAVLIYSQETDHIPGNPNINHYYKLNSKGVEASSVSTSFFRSSDTTTLVKEMSYKQYQDAFTVAKTKKQNIQI